MDALNPYTIIERALHQARQESIETCARMEEQAEEIVSLRRKVQSMVEERERLRENVSDLLKSTADRQRALKVAGDVLAVAAEAIRGARKPKKEIKSELDVQSFCNALVGELRRGASLVGELQELRSMYDKDEEPAPSLLAASEAAAAAAEEEEEEEEVESNATCADDSALCHPALDKPAL
ncbi:hypothetical protein DFH07DRAFT_994280 [Mycena maculata]|uniref:Uncharacterized protein n=1 Tax=Mycena maculata TaxID=230809 RepID=A0AAD7MTK9_9AGAR|nr:hypothetical protein DFH07DRAFT_994280 [Mycena maculata]